MMEATDMRKGHDCSLIWLLNRSWYRTRKVAVGTVKKSIETRSAAWFSRNVFQVCAGGFRWQIMYLATVDSDKPMPSIFNSPCMRGAR